MIKFTAILSAAIAAVLPVFADTAPMPKLERQSAACSAVNGASYRCMLLSGNMSPSFEIKSGNKWIPAVKNAKLIIWSDSWSRLFEGNLTSVKPVIEEKPDGLYVSFSDNSSTVECKTLYISSRKVRNFPIR